MLWQNCHCPNKSAYFTVYLLHNHSSAPPKRPFVLFGFGRRRNEVQEERRMGHFYYAFFHFVTLHLWQFNSRMRKYTKGKSSSTLHRRMVRMQIHKWLIAFFAKLSDPIRFGGKTWEKAHLLITTAATFEFSALNYSGCFHGRGQK